MLTAAAKCIGRGQIRHQITANGTSFRSVVTVMGRQDTTFECGTFCIIRIPSKASPAAWEVYQNKWTISFSSNPEQSPKPGLMSASHRLLLSECGRQRNATTIILREPVQVPERKETWSRPWRHPRCWPQTNAWRRGMQWRPSDESNCSEGRSARQTGAPH